MAIAPGRFSGAPCHITSTFGDHGPSKMQNNISFRNREFGILFEGYVLPVLHGTVSKVVGFTK